MPVEIAIKVEISDYFCKASPNTESIPWMSLSESEIDTFQKCMLTALRDISVPFSALNHNHGLCENPECNIALEVFYNDIISAIRVADLSLPRRKHGLAKDFWSPELTTLKHKSFDAHKLWQNCGCPCSGPIFDENIQSNLQYKSLLRKSKADVSTDMSERMCNNLLNKDSNSFWKTWNSANGSPNPPSSIIDGYVKYDNIASCFLNSYSSVYKDSPANDVLHEKFEHEYKKYFEAHAQDSLTPYLFSWSDMLDAVFSLKVGKAASTFVKAEHVFLGSPELLCYSHLLFNALLSHSYLPFDFLCGTISPIVKDSNGDSTNSSNYRPITLGPTFSQLFEHLLFNKFGYFLQSNFLQFGYKKKHSVSHAVFVLRSCVEYYTNHGSNVLVAFLDCSKAFDTVSHFGIFQKLLDRGVPLCFLRIFMYIYLNMKSRCQSAGDP